MKSIIPHTSSLFFFLVIFYLTSNGQKNKELESLKIRSVKRKNDNVKIKFKITDTSFAYVSNVDNLNTPFFLLDTSVIADTNKLKPRYYIDDNEIIWYKRIKCKKWYFIKIISDSIPPDFFVLRFVSAQFDTGFRVIVSIESSTFESLNMEKIFLENHSVYVRNPMFIRRKNKFKLDKLPF